MARSLTLRERVCLGALGVFSAFAAYDVGLGSAAAERRMLARGAPVLAVVILATAAAGLAGVPARIGIGPITRIALRRGAVFGANLNSPFTSARALGSGQQARPDARRGRGTA